MLAHGHRGVGPEEIERRSGGVGEEARLPQQRQERVSRPVARTAHGAVTSRLSRRLAISRVVVRRSRCCVAAVHRTRGTIGPAHRTERGVGILMTIGRVPGPGRMGGAAIPRHECRERRHLQDEPGDDRQTQTPTQ